MVRPIVAKVWIHYCDGDTQGNNRWLGHYNGSGNLQRLYRDCKCQMSDMTKVTSHCLYVKREDYYNQKVMISNCKTETEKHDVKKLFSKHHIGNAFMDIDLPLSDQFHRIFTLILPEEFYNRLYYVQLTWQDLVMKITM